MILNHHSDAPVFVGCCGFTRSRSEYYRSFGLVEIQESFYRLPRIETARRWREQAPAGFEFTMKAWQPITHPLSSPTYRRSGLSIAPELRERYGFFRASEEVRSAWERTAALARALDCRVVLLQCPASFRECPEHVANLRSFCRDLDRGPFLLAWEPRGPWKEQTVQGLCRELDLLHCVDPLVQAPLWGDPLYLRLHGGPGYRHRYTAEELSRLRAMVAGRPAYVLFNNLDRFDDALSFLHILNAPGADAHP
jgi:uncharacterized protein YecE (DUF72 family)